VRRLVVAAALVIGARAEAQRVPGWEVRVADRVELVPGASGTIAIAIAVDRGLTVSRDAAVIVDLAPDPGVTVKRRRLGRPEAVDPEADAPRFAASVRGDAAGDHPVKVRIRFWLCGGKACRPIDVRRTAVVAVTPPPAPDAGVDAAPPDAPIDEGRHRTR
jgi:hypothetical protein